MKILYNIAMCLYRFAIAIAAVFRPNIRLMYHGENEAIKRITAFRVEHCNDKVVWVHAASLGEFEQGRPVIERIKAKYPNCRVVLSFFSPSGYEVRKHYDKADIVVYLPIDTPRQSRKFVAALKPDFAIFVKYEFWLNFLAQLRKQQTPTFLISAIFRTSQPFFRWYGRIFRQCLSTFHTIYLQNEESKLLLSSIGVSNTQVVGDTRFDRVADIASAAKQLPIVDAFAAGHKVIVVGSSWSPDEQLLLPYINANAGKCRMIIAPHHVEPQRIKEITAALTCRYALYTDTTTEEATTADCLIINTIGLLSSVYQYGQVAYIGGGFGVGIHNTLEAAVWGMPVVFGTNYQRFQEACQLIDCGAARSISSEKECSEALNNYLYNDAEAAHRAGQYVKAHTGASDKIFADFTALFTK